MRKKFGSQNYNLKYRFKDGIAIVSLSLVISRLVTTKRDTVWKYRNSIGMNWDCAWFCCGIGIV